MPRNPEAHQFAKTADHQYVCVTWFERDARTSVSRRHAAA